LTYDPAAASRIRELVGQEETCCAFLDFALREDVAGLHLTITALDDAREAADLLFAHFLPDTASLPAKSKTMEKN
jgi:hypothetical protein